MNHPDRDSEKSRTCNFQSVSLTIEIRSIHVHVLLSESMNIKKMQGNLSQLL